MKLREIVSLLKVDCPVLEDVELTGVCIDSRKLTPGCLFVALTGEHFDGHDFIADAERLGAAAVVCHRLMPHVSLPQLVVPDTLQALTSLACHHRQQMDCAVIALTGSNGKTTVKEMIASILPKTAFATPGNLNNHIGVPLSLLQLTPTHRMAVFELGANHLGEIAHTVSLVQPRVALINNVATAHLEGFGTIDGVAHAKGEIYAGLASDGIAVINDDDAYAHFWDLSLEHKKTRRFSATHEADVYARQIKLDEQGCAQFSLVLPEGEALIHLAVPGLHNVNNALAAAACTSALGIALPDIVAGLERFSGVQGRMTYRRGLRDAVVIDDTYNANLRSMLTALDVLAARAGQRIFVMGDMGELGSYSQLHHQEVGAAARALGIERLMTCGEASKAATDAFGLHATHYSTQHALVEALLPQLNEKTTILVKGSRSSAMENIVREICR